MRLALLILAACATTDAVDDHVDINPDENICEREAALRGAECATVYKFARLSRTHPGYTELCVPFRFIEAAEAVYGPSWVSDDPRFAKLTALRIAPPCFWCASPGANAFDGCWVP